jgi:hypothetical protein
MGYRSITVDGTRLEYTIGRKVVKFRDVKRGVVPLEKIGYPIFGTQDFMVTPGSIKEFLTTGQIASERPCEGEQFYGCHNMVTHMIVAPRGSETATKMRYVFMCDDCLERDLEI